MTLFVETLLELVATLRTGIAAVQRAIEQVCAEHADYALFTSFPAAGPALAPRLFAAFGAERDRFSDAGQFCTRLRRTTADEH